MATKAAEQDKVMNGDGGPHLLDQPRTIRLEGFQRKYLQKLINNFEEAKKQVTMIQASAGDFIGACAEEAGVTVGLDGWQFDTEKLEFFQVKELSDGNNSGTE